MDMVSAGILGLAFILLVVFCVLAAKTWHWVNIVFVVLTFLAGVGAIFGLTKVYKLRTDAIAQVEKEQERLERVEQEADLQIYGNPTSTSYDPGSLRYIDGVVAQEMAGRGRVWSRGQVAPDGTFTFSTPRPADFDPLKDVVLYAFLEQPVAPGSSQLHPSGFIGAVRVAEETAQAVKLEPVALASAQQFAQPTGTWSLFEKMPLDRRGIFKRATISIVQGNDNAPDELKSFVETLQDENAEFDISQFRNILKSLFLQPEKVGLPPDSREYEELIDRYAFDGLSLGAIQNWIDSNSADRKSPRFEPDPEEIFIKYEFNEPSSKTYQVDANGSIETDGLFNQLGHAIDPALHAGGEIKFDKGDTVLVDQRTADGYQRGEQQIPPFKNGEDVKEVDRIYIRQVRDFPFEFADLTFKSKKIDEEIVRVQKNNEVQTKLLVDAQAQYDERLRLTGDLESDQANLKNDLTVITSLADKKTQEVSNLQQTVNSLESKIENVYKSLRDAAVKLSREAFAGR